ncbi:ATP-dependent translocase ABCB1-like isoform X1 [Mya arenaria]|uniref:ATP-dependent translocase ABCB1-like isoform X1 n=1 Tax=Mya arenaria TaxID=6604 RepID=UPI0022E850AE|nr:ATP-dependent translocase ABCB1-like isoform X1 [Mya arenaria]XP_052821018.1 ATP-dependent translocase ABCB1-like isoform X1 [Mya arenaria]XP_052821020.1 ATP-dependent translocase ABCB1-like isoform X1 [Mya arenaria]
MSKDTKVTLSGKNGGVETKTAEADKGGDGEKKDEDIPPATMGQLFRTADCLDVTFMLLGGLASIVHGAGWPMLFLFFGGMTDTFISGPSGNPNVTIGNKTNDELKDEFNDKMTEYSLYYVYIGAAVFVASYIQNSMWAISCERQTHRIRKQFFRAILRQEVAWFDVHQSGELTTRLADDLERVREGMGDKVSFTLQFLAQFLAGYVIGFIKGWKLALVLLSLSPLLVVSSAFMGKLMVSFSKREQDAYAAAGSVAEEVLSCIRTVTSFNGQRQDIDRYNRALEKSKAIGTKKSWISGLGMGFVYFTMFSAYALAFWFGNEQVKDWYDSNFEGGMTPGTVLTVFFAVLIGTFSIGNIAPHAQAIATAKGAAGKVIHIIDNKPKIDASSPIGQPVARVTGHIEFENVNFTYPTRKDVPVLKGLNLRVEPGQTVALVGPSGCGKSTVINLIQRFYDPDQGRVLVDGQDIRSLQVAGLRRNIGVVSQEPILFGLTIRENILLGRPDARTQEIEAAASMANCHDFITKLPKSYETLVGERGAQLSGGQKQRVAIARALIRDPKILLLDEATSALDTESERVVQDALDKARQGRTTIVIAHRLSTIQNADVIYVVEDGVIVESGRHADLMSQKGAYYQLVTVQMLVEEGDNGDEDDFLGEEAQDIVENGVPRKRTLSGGDGKVKKQVSRQISKQLSKVKEEKEKEEVEQETAPKSGFCSMLRENRKEWPLIVLGCIAAAVNGATMPVFAVFFSEMIKVFINRGENGLFWSMMFLVLGGTQFLTLTIQTVSFGYSGETLTKRLRLKTFNAFLRQDVAYFDDAKHSTGALTTRLATDASLVKNATGIRIATVLQSLVGMVAALTISFIYGWQLALVVLGGVPLMVAAGAIQLKTVMGTQKKDNVDLELAGKTASESIENVRTVQALSREPEFYTKYTSYLETPYRTKLRMTQLQAFGFGFSSGIVFFLYAGCFRFGAYMVTLGQMQPDDVFKVFFAIAFTGLVLGQVSSFLPDYSKAATAGGMIFKILDTIPAIDVSSERGQYLSDTSGNVEFRGIQFRYPTRPDVEVLKGINISVKAGQTVALVGPSGCGKSTVVSLLQRYYDPQQGSIEVDGTNIKDVNIKRLRFLISVVSQEPILFDCSIRENILYGLDVASYGMDDVISAARSANIHEYIASLPEGYDTVVGEKGTQLSGGQKQRVAIARALIRNPRILLLDEATSALDTESEKVVQAALDNAQKGRTCIVIAHRLSTVQNADYIYVIDAGNVVESGNHHQLLSRKGVYAQLVSGQQLAK